MNIQTTDLDGVLILEPVVHRDDRGFFLETYHADKYREAGVDATFVQDNHSKSVRGTLRGLHSQWRKPQGKLVRCLAGEIFDVAVDMRHGSPTRAQWVGVTLTSDNFKQIYVPPGFLHGFVVVSDVAEVEYKCTDPEIGIDWPVPAAEVLLSGKAAVAPQLAEAPAEQVPTYAG